MNLANFNVSAVLSSLLVSVLSLAFFTAYDTTDSDYYSASVNNPFYWKTHQSYQKPTYLQPTSVVKSPRYKTNTSNKTEVRQTAAVKVLKEKPWDGYFAAESFNSPQEKVSLNNIKKTLQDGILSLPESHTDSLKTLKVKNHSHQSRGLANNDTLILNVGTIDSDEELLSVFTHEMGHIVDLGGLRGKYGQKTSFVDRGRTVLSDDISYGFYQIAWLDSDTKKRTMNRTDFISGYAMSDPFEDFAESYIFYRLHGEKFRYVARNSSTLQAKYNFMRDQIFDGEEFQKDKRVDYFANTAWDATLVN